MRPKIDEGEVHPTLKQQDAFRIYREWKETTKTKTVEPEVVLPAKTNLDIRQGDFRVVLGDVPDESVDLILTDPPYSHEDLPLSSDLAKHAGGFSMRSAKMSDKGLLTGR